MERRKWKWSHSVVSNSLQPHGGSPWNSPSQNTGMGPLSLLQGIFPTQGSHPGLPHGRHILYQLSQKGSPRILEWIAHPFSKGSSRPRNWTRVSYIADGFFTNWAIREEANLKSNHIEGIQLQSVRKVVLQKGSWTCFFDKKISRNAHSVFS